MTPSTSSPPSPSSIYTLALLKSIKKPSHTALAGAIVGVVVFLLSMTALLFFFRRRRASKASADRIGGVERGPDPTLDNVDSAKATFLDGDGQPAGHDVFSDTVSEISSERTKSTPAPIAAITGGIAQGANLAGDAVLSLQRKLFKRPTGESTTDMELQPSTPAAEAAPADTTSRIPRAEFFAKIAKRTRKNPATENTADTELESSALEAAADPAPEITREGFFTKIARKTKKISTTDSTAKETLSGDDGLTFQERLFKRPTTDATTEITAEVETETEPPVLSGERADIIDLQDDASSTRQADDAATVAETKSPSESVLNFRYRFFKQTATDTTVPGNSDSSDERPTSPPAPDATLATTASDPTPKESFMMKLRHKFSKPAVVPDPESARDPDLSDFHVIQPGEEAHPGEETDAETANSSAQSITPTDGHSSQPAPIPSLPPLDTQFTFSELPPSFDAAMTSDSHPQTAPGTPTTSTSRSLSTMKRDQTRAVQPGRLVALNTEPDAGDSSSYLLPPSDPPPTATELPAVTRSLSTTKRDQTRVISRDEQHNATDVLVQTPGGLQLMPGQSRVVSTDESRAVASELRDLREYIRVLEADLAAGRNRGGDSILPPPPSYDETS